MNKTLKIILISIFGLLLAAGLVVGGFLLGSTRGLLSAVTDRAADFKPPFDPWQNDEIHPVPFHAPGRFPRPAHLPQRLQPFNPAPGGAGRGAALEALSEEQAKRAVEDFLADLELNGLETGHVILVGNHAYATVQESDSGNAAFEVHVLPDGRHVIPEHNPWNVKYSDAIFGKPGIRGLVILNPEEPPAMSLTAEQALLFAQSYADKYLPELMISGEPVAVPGYYSILAGQDGEVIAILHVNGYTGQTYAIPLADRFKR